MQVLIIPVALYLLLYAPGRFLLRTRVPAAAAPEARLLREVLVSASCTSWVGLVLAEVGWFSLAALLGSLTVITAGAWLCTRRARPSAYRLDDLAGVMLLV